MANVEQGFVDTPTIRWLINHTFEVIQLETCTIENLFFLHVFWHSLATLTIAGNGTGHICSIAGFRSACAVHLKVRNERVSRGIISRYYSGFPTFRSAFHGIRCPCSCRVKLKPQSRTLDGRLRIFWKLDNTWHGPRHWWQDRGLHWEKSTS